MRVTLPSSEGEEEVEVDVRLLPKVLIYGRMPPIGFMPG
jgi:hypothetical protein